MPASDSPETPALGLGLVGLGALLSVAAAVGLFAAAGHMAVASGTCGPAAAHCLLCLTAAVALLAAIGVVGAGAMLLGPRSVLGRAAQIPVRR